MQTETLLFSLFSSLALLSGVLVIRSKNPVHSVLFLILAFCSVSGLLLMLGLDFFAMVFLVVYVGAIAVLFLFVVMMLNIKTAEVSENVLRYLPIGGLIGLLFILEVLLIVDSDLVPLLRQGPISQGSTGGLWVEFLSLSVPALLGGKVSLETWRKDWALFQADCESLGGQDVSFQALPQVLQDWSAVVEPMTNIKALGQLMYTYECYYFLVASLILLVAMVGAIVLTMHKASMVRRQDVFAQNTREHTKTVHKVRG